MSDEPKATAHVITEVEMQLEQSGWLRNELLRTPAVQTQLGTYRPDLALTHALYPLATLEAVRPDAPPGDASGASNASAGGPFPIRLQSDGASTWQEGAKLGTHWTPVPSPQDLWSLLGRTWDAGDPRLTPMPIG